MYLSNSFRLSQFKRASAFLLASMLSLGSVAVSADAKGPRAPDQASILALAESKTEAESNFEPLLGKYFEFVFSVDPVFATQLGLHKYDQLTPDYSATAISDAIEKLKDFRQKFDAIDSSQLGKQSVIDLKLIKANVNARIFTLDELKEWRRNPDMYSALSSSMIYDLMSRNFAPLNERLRSVIARERAIPKILADAKQNLKSVPKIYTDIALEQLDGIIDFFQSSVPDTFKTVSDKGLLDEFSASNKNVIASLQEYKTFLKDVVLPNGSDSFAYGETLYSKKLLYDEMVSTPIEQLIAEGDKELKRLQSEFDKTAKELDPSKTAIEVFRSLSTEHSAPDKLLASTEAMLGELRAFCLDKKIVSMPHEGELKVEPTPPFMKALTFAAMSWAGPFEEKAKESYYYVTVPEKSWTPEHTEQHMRSFGKFSLMDTSVHEVFPGHYVQGLWLRQAPSRTEKIISCNSNIEGWAHYSEQMMVEEKLENGDKRLKLAMLHKALRRACRYLVALRMHTRGMSFDDGVKFFMSEAHEEKSNAERETRRGTIDATYLVYTLGKLQIMSLRDEYKKKEGERFQLINFHNEFLSNGAMPVPLIKDVMLGNK